MSNTVHCYPVNDLVEHNTDTEECICGPTPEYVPNPNGPDGWVIVHHSLDGRELNE